MLDINKIRDIITLSLDKGPLTVKDLQENNISKQDINDSINKGILRKENGERYVIVCHEKIYHYGSDLANKRQYDKAIKCFEKCIELKPTDRDAYLQLMLIHIERGKYSESFEVYDSILRLNDQDSIPDDNFILYLLSLVSNYPEKYKQRILSMEYNDILITTSNKKYSRIQEQNKVRIRVFQNRLNQAETILKYSEFEDFPNKVEKKIIQILLYRAIENDKKQTEYLLYLTKEKDYSRMISLLDKKRQKRKLSLSETFILFIAKNIIWITDNKKIPKIKVTEATTLKDALKGNNFGLALQLNKEYLQNSSNDKSKNYTYDKAKDIVTILLVEINKLIKEVIEERKIQIQQEVDAFNFKRIEDIAYYIKENNINIIEAITQFSLTDEDCLLIKLIYAIDYYTEEKYKEGDALCQDVESSSDKTLVVIAKLNEVKTNKTAYKNSLKKKKRVQPQ